MLPTDVTYLSHFIARRGQRKAVSPLPALGTFLLADAADEEEERMALLVLALVMRQSPSARYGPRGRYNAAKLELW
ncbi:hypothetical protein M422DRAFT_243897 [Sphaerobolus stellatus SS14]|nr:hypothetical protein M422DRAFT_243897 [Sphaerobolus stellatus SS14]